MKFFYIFLLTFLPLVAFAQVFDDFSDGDFTQNPQWNGTIEKFVVSNGELQLNDVSASGSGSIKAYLSTVSEAILNGSWSCKIKVNTALTSANYVRYYLISDTANLTASLKGYYIMIGNTAKEVSLYKQNGTTLTKIIDGTDNRVASTTSNFLYVKAERDSAGNWVLYSKLDGESDFVSEGSCFDNSSLNAKYSGIYINYSSGNKDKYFFDDFLITGEPYVFVPQTINRNDIIINEIMADPDPVVGLPNFEYVELYNRTQSPVNLAGWKISCGNSVGTVQQGEIPPHGFLLLCSASARSEFEQFGIVAQVSSFPNLTNSSGLLVLQTDNNQIITFTEYSDKWFGSDNFRKDGGFSLERIDTDNLNNSAENWQPSQDTSGGTPCKQNSVCKPNSDGVFPLLSAVSLMSNNSVALIFNKEMENSTLSDVQNYFSQDLTVVSAMPELPKNQKVTIVFSPALAENDTIEIFVKNLRCISDFALPDFSFEIALPQEIDANDLIINELLFNANTGVATFAELFNPSQKVLDLSEVFLTRWYNGSLDTRRQVTTEHILLFPQKYLLLSTDINSVCQAYGCDESALKIECVLPSLPNSAGTLVVTKNDASIIDEFSYSEKMHQNFVSNPKGVSLERINPYLSTQDVNNWHSASFDQNYGTPSRQNSQYNITKTKSDKTFWLEYESFTPDNDGVYDILPLNYKFSDTGYSITANIYNPSGIKVRNLCSNAIAGHEGTIIWNGLSDNGSICHVGIYVIVIEAINTTTGKKIREKIVCVLSANG
ncbi:MAG: lamin tail domain-containing protein [Prevotellaceae bacterium]|jgi:hypothetical protein|nr:lamin tail domain-containing protein [Prevotellaceae bacterium]